MERWVSSKILLIFGLFERLIRLNSSLHPNRTRDSTGTERLNYPAPLPHHRGTPARRAIDPGMPIPRLDPEAGLARGCGERAHLKMSSKHQKLSSVGEPLAPHTGYSFGPRPPDRLLAAGLGSRRLTLHLPHFPLPITGEVGG
jgi:hypothetical protein